MHTPHSPESTSPSLSVRAADPAGDRSPPDNPVVARVWRGSWVESQHRGAWVLVDSAGRVQAGGGAFEQPVFARSAVKSLQALPLIESGAADAAGWTERELALALASHNAEACHTETVLGLLARLGLSEDDLQCGPQPPGDWTARAELMTAGRQPSRVHSNCSGKHTGFLCLAQHLGVPTDRYLEVDSEGQRQVLAAVAAMADLDADAIGLSTDGCSAPSFRLPLAALGLAFARLTNPAGLEPGRRRACERMVQAVAAHPELIAGTRKRLCTDIARASGGRVFPKIGGQAVYVLGERGAGRALAVKVDDGSLRGLHALVMALAERFGFLTPAELEGLAAWRPGPLRNWAGLEVGRLEVVV